MRRCSSNTRTDSRRRAERRSSPEIMAATATRAGTKLLTPAGLPPRAARTTTTTTTTVLPLTSPAGQRSYRYDRASSLSLSSARASVSWLACRQASSSSSPAQHQLLRGQRRGLHGTALLRSGHNRWSSIKHDKAKNDKNKSKERSMISRDIIAASRRKFCVCFYLYFFFISFYF